MLTYRQVTHNGKWILPQMEIIKVHKVPLVEFMYLIFTRMPGQSYRSDSGFKLLLYLGHVFGEH